MLPSNDATFLVSSQLSTIRTLTLLSYCPCFLSFIYIYIGVGDQVVKRRGLGLHYPV